MYKVVEVFSSIQGEGQNVGLRMLFVRMFGCNLKCSFCDESKHTNEELIKEYKATQLVEMAEKANVRWVCITGGEPTLTDLNSLIAAFQHAGFRVQVETNGHNLSNCVVADLVTVSPKGDTVPRGIYDELKIIIPAQEKMLPYVGKTITYLQPENYEHAVNPVSVKRCLKLQELYPHFRLSVQLHKLIGVE